MNNISTFKDFLNQSSQSSINEALNTKAIQELIDSDTPEREAIKVRKDIEDAFKKYAQGLIKKFTLDTNEPFEVTNKMSNAIGALNYLESDIKGFLLSFKQAPNESDDVRKMYSRTLHKYFNEFMNKIKF